MIQHAVDNLWILFTFLAGGMIAVVAVHVYFKTQGRAGIPN